MERRFLVKASAGVPAPEPVAAHAGNVRDITGRHGWGRWFRRCDAGGEHVSFKWIHEQWDLSKRNGGLSVRISFMQLFWSHLCNLGNSMKPYLLKGKGRNYIRSLQRTITCSSQKMSKHSCGSCVKTEFWCSEDISTSSVFPRMRLQGLYNNSNCVSVHVPTLWKRTRCQRQRPTLPLQGHLETQASRRCGWKK